MPDDGPSSFDDLFHHNFFRLVNAINAQVEIIIDNVPGRRDQYRRNNQEQTIIWF
jgi:hypothetical protein